MHVVIDLMGDEDVIVIKREEEDPKVLAEREEKRRKFLEEVFKRAPQPQLEIVPVERT